MSFNSFDTPSVFSGCLKYEDQCSKSEEKKDIRKDTKTVSTEGTAIINPRCCPICNTDLSWIPVSVPCPKCNYLADEKPPVYNDRLTADMILKMHTMSCNDMSSEEDIKLDDLENMQVAESKPVTENKHVTENKQIEPKSIFQVKDNDVEVAQPIKRQKKRVSRMKRVRMYTRPIGNCAANANFKTQDPRITAFIKSLLPSKPKRHASCACGPCRVPANMGWMWTVFAKGTNEKWRPGAIRRSIKEIMSWFLKDFPIDSIPVSRYAGWRTKRNSKEVNCERIGDQKPLLHIVKKKEEYIVTLRPLKRTAELLESVDPYLNVKPIKFRITRNPTSLFIHDLKRKILNLGYTPCVCHNPISQCVCHSFKDKTEINHIVEQECFENLVPKGNDTFVMSELTESESEIDFAVTPPISRLKPQNLSKPDYAHVGTQYSMEDWSLKPKISIFGPPSKCKKPKLNINKCQIFVNKCTQNIQPPIIMPKFEKKPKDGKKKGKKGKKKGTGRRK